MSGSAFAVTHHAFSSGAGRTSDGNGSHASTLKSPSYTKSVSWQHYPLLEGSEYDYFFFVTNTTLLSEKVVIYYEKRGNAENYIKEAKYDMAVGHLLLKSFWANEAVFQMMMLSYNLFLLFKFDSLDSSEYRQQIKTFRLKYVFLAAKIIKTARYVIMKLSENYPYKGVYEKCLV
ncbi:TPA: transposase [Escherichia coli]